MALTNYEKQKRFRLRQAVRLNRLKLLERFFNAHCMRLTWEAEIKSVTEMLFRDLNIEKENG